MEIAGGLLVRRSDVESRYLRSIQETVDEFGAYMVRIDDIAFFHGRPEAGGKPVVLRTLDIGADKVLPYLPAKHEDNPALGLRALRFCFEHEALFQTQLRAALRASAYGNLWLMLPMVGGMDDINRAKAILNAVKEDLRAEKIDFRSEMKIGIMIEIPSIALIADVAAKTVDFASIGTNDLCQYTHAADRKNTDVTAYYQEKSKAMCRLIDMAIRGFREAGKPISVCRELGGDPEAAMIPRRG